MKKQIGILFLFVANFFFLAHALMPHNHHNGHVVSVVEKVEPAHHSHESNHHHDHHHSHGADLAHSNNAEPLNDIEHNHSSENFDNCTLKEVLLSTGFQFKPSISSIVSSDYFIFDAVPISRNPEINAKIPISIIRAQIDLDKQIYTDYFVKTKGLRAPPIV